MSSIIAIDAGDASDDDGDRDFRFISYQGKVFLFCPVASLKVAFFNRFFRDVYDDFYGKNVMSRI